MTILKTIETHTHTQHKITVFVGFHYFFLTKPLYIENKFAFFVVSGNKPKQKSNFLCLVHLLLEFNEFTKLNNDDNNYRFS